MIISLQGKRGESVRPTFNYSKSSTDQNLTRLIMTTANDYDEAQQLIKAIFSLSPEPRIYSYSIHKQTESLFQPKNKLA